MLKHLWSVEGVNECRLYTLHSDAIAEPFLVPQRNILPKNRPFLTFYNLKDLL